MRISRQNKEGYESIGSEIVQNEKVVYEFYSDIPIEIKTDVSVLRKVLEMTFEYFKLELKLKKQSKFYTPNIPLNKPSILNIKRNGVIEFTTDDERFESISNRLVLNRFSTKSPQHLIEYIFESTYFYKNVSMNSNIEFNPINKLFGNNSLEITLKTTEETQLHLRKRGLNYRILTKGEEIEYQTVDNTFHPDLSQSNLDDIKNQRWFEFISNPLKTIIESNLSEGVCCFCNRPLSSKSSISNGYGKVCSEKYNLPWISI